MSPSRFCQTFGVQYPIVMGGMQWAGMVQGLVHDIPSVAELVTRIMTEAHAVVGGRLPGLLPAAASVAA